ncbi:hypothetical protein ACHWQZ_G014685 [Mnemiopsis leidyi]
MVGDATLGFGRDTALGKHQTHTTPTTNRENDAHMNTGRGGSIDVLTLGEQARGTGTETYENEPSKDRPQNCEWCGKGFKQVAKHRWSCKLRLQGGPLTGKTADIPVDAVTTGRDQLRKSERKSCQDSTHSAVTTEACLASFSIKDYWRKRAKRSTVHHLQEVYKVKKAVVRMHQSAVAVRHSSNTVENRREFLEHTQALMEELRDAKSKRRQVYAVWIDLMNAYGRVPNEQIVFALRHYKFPDEVVEYIVKYYDELIVRVKTRKWKSKWFYCMIGLFQGDPLSVVLFLIAFNLLLDLIQVEKREVLSFEDQKAQKLKRYEQLLVEIETAGLERRSLYSRSWMSTVLTRYALEDFQLFKHPPI